MNHRTPIDLSTLDVGIHVHPYTNTSALRKHGAAKVFRSGKGIYLFDSNRKKYIDGVSGLWSVNLGYSCTRVIEAIREQATVLPFGSTHAWSTNEAATQLISKLLKLSDNHFSGVALANSGSEAIELSYYAAEQYWTGQGFQNKNKVICLDGGYHGSTLFTRALSYHGSDDLKKKLGVYPIIVPERFGEKKLNKALVDSIDRYIEEIGADQISYFIMETIQLRNGVNFPENDFFPLLEARLARHKILLVLDESVTAVGRIGSWYGYQSFNARPNMIIVSKGLSAGYQPISALLMDTNLHSQLLKSEKLFEAGFSTSGHPIACRSALATIEEIEEVQLLQKINDEKIPFFQGLCESISTCPNVQSVRNFGLLAAVDFGESAQALAKDTKDQCLRDGLIVRHSGSSVLLCPPLITSKSEMANLFKILERSIRSMRVK